MEVHLGGINRKKRIKNESRINKKESIKIKITI